MNLTYDTLLVCLQGLSFMYHLITFFFLGFKISFNVFVTSLCRLSLLLDHIRLKRRCRLVCLSVFRLLRPFQVLFLFPVLFFTENLPSHQEKTKPSFILEFDGTNKNLKTFFFLYFFGKGQMKQAKIKHGMAY